MSLIDLLDNDELWDEFLEHKVNSSHLPEKVLKRYIGFIENRKYKQITKKIINNTYQFSIPKKVMIGKMGKSKKRIVYMYKEEETYVLKMLSYLLYKYDYLFTPNLYSFRQNSGVKKAIGYISRGKRINKMFGYKVDIKNYFNSIPVYDLLKELGNDLVDIAIGNVNENINANESRIGNESQNEYETTSLYENENVNKNLNQKDEKLFNLINALLTNQNVMYNNAIIKEEKGIMAGVPISSFLANYYLKDLDKYFYENNIMYVRYADDIIVFGKTKEQVSEYRSFIIDFLKQKKLQVNPEKEYFYNCGDKIEFLGFSYQNGIIDLSNNSFKKIKGKIRRTARGLRRWMLKKNASAEVTLKAMNRKFNRKFFGKNENDLTWKYWFFPIINTDETLKKVDEYMQEEQRYVVTGVHNKKNYEKVPYEFLKKCNYKSLVNEYYKSKEEALHEE